MRDLAERWLDHTRANTGQSTAAAAAAWLTGLGINTALAAAVRTQVTGMWADGIHIGATSATALADGTDPDWTGWTPGRAPDTGDPAYQEMLRDQGDIITGIADHTLGDLSKVLADAVNGNLSVHRLEGALRDHLADKARARAVATTEITRGQAQGAVTAYKAANLTMSVWLAEAGACPVCQANADAAPRPFGYPFPSGDPFPPAHPNCRCMPGVSDTTR